MGYIVYDAVVATGFSRNGATSERVAQWKAGLEPEWQALVVGPGGQTIMSVIMDGTVECTR